MINIQIQNENYIIDTILMTEKHYIAPTKGKTKFSHYPIKPELLELLESQNFRKPTVVQAQSLPITLQENLKGLCAIAYAYNGAGKTLTFLIPILNVIDMIPQMSAREFRGKDIQEWRPQAIIVCPTQTLLTQIYEYLDNYAGFYENRFKWPLKIGRVYSNKTEPGHIIVAMTDRMSKIIKGLDCSELKWVVFDECDKIRDDSQKLFQQILQQIEEKAPFSNLLITSATGDKKAFRHFIQDNLRTHNILELDTKQQNEGLKGVTHYYSDRKGRNKDQTILNLLEQLSKKDSKIQVIIFFNEIKTLQNFYALLNSGSNNFVVNDSEADSKKKNNLNINYIHGRVGYCSKKQHSCPEDCSKTKSQRVGLLRNGEIQVLLGTQTIGRGIDIRTVSLVINYEEPIKNKGEMSSTAYIHRVGRTGRYSDEGIALTFIENESERFVEMVEKQEKVEFQKMTSEIDILQQAIACAKKNEELTQSHRFHQQ